METKTLQFALEPVDNQRLARLCGALDENLRQIETALEVSIARRGEHFSVQGAQAELARQVLQDFYLEAKHDITLERLQLGLIEAMKWCAESQPASDFVPLLMTRKAEIRGRTPRQNAYLQAIQEHDITFGVGPAGTGKTYLAVACAVDALQREAVRRLVLVRPAVFLTRIGFGSKAVITGDVTQIDLVRGQKSGLIEARGILKEVRGIAFSDFLAEDVVRHPLVQKIVAAYEQYEQQRNP